VHTNTLIVYCIPTLDGLGNVLDALDNVLDLGILALIADSNPAHAILAYRYYS
jgi:hypothetical protein